MYDTAHALLTKHLHIKLFQIDWNRLCYRRRHHEVYKENSNKSLKSKQQSLVEVLRG